MLEIQKGQAVSRMDPIEELMRLYYAPVCRFAFSILGDADDAEDAAQETFVRAARASSGFRGEASPRTWLYAIALNVCRGELRKRRARASLQNALGKIMLLHKSEANVEDLTVTNENHEHLSQIVASLDEKHRLPILLRYVHNLTASEIAVILETNEGTIHSRLHYAREKIARHLGDNFPGSNRYAELKEVAR